MKRPGGGEKQMSGALLCPALALVIEASASCSISFDYRRVQGGSHPDLPHQNAPNFTLEQPFTHTHTHTHNTHTHTHTHTLRSVPAASASLFTGKEQPTRTGNADISIA